MNPNQQIKFDSFNDGIISFGDYIELYDDNGDATIKEFATNGRLYFSLSAIREQDSLKYDSTKKVTLKIKTPYIPLINSNHVVNYNDDYYSITHIEPGINRKNLFIYLSSYIESMRYKVEVLDYAKPSPLEDARLTHYRTLWCDVTSNKASSTQEADKSDLVAKKTFTIRYLESLDHTINSISNKRLKFKGKTYKILSTTNVDEMDELLVLEVVEV